MSATFDGRLDRRPVAHGARPAEPWSGWRNERRLAISHAVAQALEDARTVDEAAGRVMAAICERMGWDAGVRWEPDRAGTGLRCAQSWVDPSAALPLEDVVRHLGAGPRSELRERACRDETPRWAEGDGAGGGHGLAAIPIRMNGERAGVLELAGPSHCRPDALDLEWLGQAGRRLGSFMHRLREERLMRLEHEVTRCLAQSDDAGQALREVLRGFCTAMDWECGRFFGKREGVFRFQAAWHLGGPELERFVAASREKAFAPGAGIVGMAGAGQVQWVADIASDPRVIYRDMSAVHRVRCAFMFPVTSQGEHLGVLSFTSREIRRPDERLLEAARVIGSQIGQFLHRHLAQHAVRESEARLRAIIDSAHEGILAYGPDFRIVSCNGAAERILGLPRERLIGADGFTSLLPCLDQDGSPLSYDRRPTRITARTGKPVEGSVMGIRREGGAVQWLSLNTGLMRHAGEPSHFGMVTTFSDITERRRHEERIRFLAGHDVLTRLPNRASFSEALRHAIAQAAGGGTTFAVLFLDLDRFKVVNDSLGHAAGDELLRTVAGRLSACARPGDVVARLGGDEFVVLAREVEDPSQAHALARRLLAAVSAPTTISGVECAVTGSIGVSLYPSDGEDEKSLMRCADLAMYRAKDEGKDTMRFFSRERGASSGGMVFEAALRRAAERGELVPHYQPQVDLRTGEVTGVEALLRWSDPQLGEVPPSRFIPVAEETGLIVPIGRAVLRAACHQALAWERAGMGRLRMCVNLSARQFAEQSLMSDIAEVLAETGLPPDRLELELTESMVTRDVAMARQVLSALRSLGVRVAIDDFGIGHSNLAHLKRFPVDTLKIDRAFVQEVAFVREDAAIVAAIVAMGRALALNVVAEGVETYAQEAFLREQGCQQAQGYRYGRPVDAARFEQDRRAGL